MKSCLTAHRAGRVKALAHITGGGLIENLPRVLPPGVGVEIDGVSWAVPAVFAWLARDGGVALADMVRTFNCGIGMAVVVAPGDEAAATEKALQLVDAIENTSIDWSGTAIPLKVAFGAYTFKGGENANEALAEADKKMYAQKNSSKVPAES